jgi:hypothetical protein
MASITLSWPYNDACDGFYVKRCVSGDTGGFALIATLPPDATSYVDADPALVFGRQYQYQVTAFNEVGESAATAVTVDFSPPIPTPVGKITTTINN